MGLLVSACGSGDEGSSPGAPETTAAVAGAQENSIIVPKSGQESGSIVPESSQENAVAVCKDWPAGTSVVPCAVGAMGPGGGRVFYDAGSEQPWGRFLEVAPQTWGETLYECSSWRFSCGYAGGVAQKTADAVDASNGYFPCTAYAPATLLSGAAGDTLWEVGGGRRNTEVLLQATGCYDGTVSALQLVTEYRVRSGLSDWHLPSGGELTELCKYEGRNAIGGFVNQEYLSSTVGPKNGYTNFFSVDFAGNPICARTDALGASADGTVNDYYYYPRAVRPIRAFS
jgi:hypothetical protein